MAIITAGATASWGGIVFGTVVELRATLGGSLPINRGSTQVSQTWTGGEAAYHTSAYGVDVGTIEVLCLSTANISVAEWGRKRVLSFGGTAFVSGTTGPTRSVQISTKAICQTLQVGAKVNDVWRLQGTFKLVRE
jgi:hypothetical protein